MLRNKVFFSVLLAMFLAVLAFYVVTAIYGNVVGGGVKVCIVDSSTSSISGVVGLLFIT